jgi:hypothetical protein
MPNRAEERLAEPLPDISPELINLRTEVNAFLELDSGDASAGARYHHVLAAVHRICAAIEDCERAGIARGEIVGILEPVRRIHARSPFVKRLQEWPRGYPGDFETVEYLCRGPRDIPAQTIAEICE